MSCSESLSTSNDALERLARMFKQEIEVYHIPLCITQSSNIRFSVAKDWHEDRQNQPPSSYIHQRTKTPTDLGSMSSDPNLIDIIDCRYKMASWCYDLVGFCEMSNETAELAMSCLDRFMFVPDTWKHKRFFSRTVCSQAVSAAWTNKKVYQLVSMSAMYLAVKIQEPAAFNPKMVSEKLSRSTYTPIQIENMEAVILETLMWRINPPTTSAYVHELMILISPALSQDENGKLILEDSDTQETFQDLIDRQVKLMTLDYNFIATKNSTRAHCAILNVLEYLNISPLLIRKVDGIIRKAFYPESTLSLDKVELKRDKIIIQEIRQTLYGMMMSGEISPQKPIKFSPPHRSVPSLSSPEANHYMTKEINGQTSSYHSRPIVTNSLFSTRKNDTPITTAQEQIASTIASPSSISQMQ